MVCGRSTTFTDLGPQSLLPVHTCAKAGFHKVFSLSTRVTGGRNSGCINSNRGCEVLSLELVWVTNNRGPLNHVPMPWPRDGFPEFMKSYSQSIRGNRRFSQYKTQWRCTQSSSSLRHRKIPFQEEEGRSVPCSGLTREVSSCSSWALRRRPTTGQHANRKRLGNNQP